MVKVMRLFLLAVLPLLAATEAAAAGADGGYYYAFVGTPPGSTTFLGGRQGRAYARTFRNRWAPYYYRRSVEQGVFDAPQAGSSSAYGGTRSRWSVPTATTTTRLLMGLYDQPVPPRPPPVPPNKRGRQSDSYNSFDDDEEEDDDDEDEDEYDDVDGITNQQKGPVGSADSTSSTRINLFAFDEKGREINNLLPNLGRRLDRGVGCYYEPSDRVVQSLVRRTSCSPTDACWALEACKGDVTEAWTRISVARRTNLEDKRLTRTDSNTGEGGEDGSDSTYQVLDADVLELEMEEEFMELKQRRMEDQKKRDVQDFFKGGDKDQDWLPRQTKGPVDDEPWFTG